MKTKQKQQRAANITALLVGLAAVVIYVGFYFLVLNAR